MKAAQLSGLIFVVITIHSADSIQCFKCTSANDDNCILLAEESIKYLDHCDNADYPTHEFKCLETLAKKEDKYTVVRDCISTERLNYCKQLETKPNLNTLICKICDDKDGCNDDQYYLNRSKNNKPNANFNKLNSVVLVTIPVVKGVQERAII